MQWYVKFLVVEIIEDVDYRKVPSIWSSSASTNASKIPTLMKTLMQLHRHVEHDRSKMEWYNLEAY